MAQRIEALSVKAIDRYSGPIRKVTQALEALSTRLPAVNVNCRFRPALQGSSHASVLDIAQLRATRYDIGSAVNIREISFKRFRFNEEHAWMELRSLHS